MPNNETDRVLLEEIKKLTEKNSELIQEIQKQMRFVHSYIFWQRVWGTIKVLFIISLIVVGSIYLPPLIQNIIAPYKEIMQELGSDDKNMKNIFQQIQNLQKFPSPSALFGK